MWFTVGIYVGLIAAIAYIALIFSKTFRNVLHQTVFDNTIYGEILELLNDEEEYKEGDVSEKFFVMFIVSIITIIISCLIWLIFFSLSYIAILVTIVAILLYYNTEEQHK